MFAGPVGIRGALRKATESFHQKTIDRCRRAYEKERSVPLRVAILGKVTRGSMEELLTTLLCHDLESMQPGEQFEVEISDQFKAHVARALRHQWFRGERPCRLGEHQSVADDRRGRGKEI